MEEHYTIWGIDTGNQIFYTTEESKAISMLKDLINCGWDRNDLLLAVDIDGKWWSVIGDDLDIIITSGFQFYRQHSK